MNSYNPYDLISISINNKIFSARPIEFDSEIINAKDSTNFFGRPVKPIKVSTLCPDCGQGIIVEVELNDPPFDIVAIRCPECNPEIIMTVVDPFVNPIEIGLISLEESGKKSKINIIQEKTPVKSNNLNYEFDLSKSQKSQKRPTILSNDEISEEIEFDDHELVDDE